MPESEQGLTAPRNDVEPVNQPSPVDDSIALMFRRERIVRMRELSEIAKQLKIREFYLQAIEDGAFEDLPDGSYAVGFVRAYAEFLGLDSAEIVERFKSEMEETKDAPLPPPPAFPTVNRNAPNPRAAVLFIFLLLLASIYAGWWYRSGADHSQAEWGQEAPASYVRGMQD